MSQGPRLRARLAEIARQIGVLEAKIAVLRDEQQSVEADLEGLVYPILTLPNEITSEIFFQYVDVEIGADPIQSPMYLTWVCRSWRDVAVSTPRLWINFQRHFVPFLPLWLSRTGNLPVTVQIISLLRPCHDAEFLETFSKYSSRCEKLDLRLDEPRPSLGLSGPFPRLETFRFNVYGDATTPIPVLHDAPSLRQVHLGGVSFENWRTALPWAQLTKLVIYATVFMCHEVVVCTPNLEHLQLTSNHTGSRPETFPPTPASLARLRTLILDEFWSFEILRHLVIPDLKDLSFSLGENGEANVLKSLFKRSKCSPRHLSVDVMHADEAMITEFLERAPLQSIQKLTLSGTSMVEDGLDSLFTRLSAKHEKMILPSLKHLVLKGCGLAIDVPLLVDMLASRRPAQMPEGVEKIKSFGVTFCEEARDPFASGADPRRIPQASIVNDALTQLHSLMSEGLGFNLEGPDWYSRHFDVSVVEEIYGLLTPSDS
ncbi:hypothetical protein FB45DRAFT_1053275 [Roridomyces roridus]|uniref:F-box domain-containing protein n=1 Tax=Roridomyces roridus TaxID=1738132 RepID=A0AAD7CCA5_9AGAR|nr:hypothetical protein FB45DRAFT_1053275 [Roridomyces roridus]